MFGKSCRVFWEFPRVMGRILPIFLYNNCGKGILIMVSLIVFPGWCWSDVGGGGFVRWFSCHISGHHD